MIGQEVTYMKYQFCKKDSMLSIMSVICCLLMSGCMGPDVCVVDAATGRVCELSCSGYRQWIIAVNDEAAEFTTLTTRGSQASIRTCGYDGKIRRQFPCPPTLRNRSVYDGFAATKNVSYLAYRKVETGHLYVYDCKSGVEKLVCENVASSHVWDSVKGLEWLAETKVLLLLNEDKAIGRESPTIDILNLVTKERRTVFRPNENIFAYSVSPDNRKVAICDGNWLTSIVRVIDLETGVILAATKAAGHYEVCWMLTGDAVGYEIERKTIVVLSLADGKARVVQEMQEDRECFFMVLLNNAFAYSSIPADTPFRGPKMTPMYIHDLMTKDRKLTVNQHFNGRWFVADGGKKIICEIGY